MKIYDLRYIFTEGIVEREGVECLYAGEEAIKVGFNDYLFQGQYSLDRHIAILKAKQRLKIEILRLHDRLNLAEHFLAEYSSEES